MNLAHKGRDATAAAAVTVAVAAICWVAVLVQMNAMSMGSGMGLGSLGSFAGLWTVMMAAMMLPTAVPLVRGFVHRNRMRRGWPGATTVLAAVYLLVWTGFGVVAYYGFSTIQMVRPQSLPWVQVTGAAIALAGLYALTPVRRTCQARCRALCRDTREMQRRPVPSALATGFEYGVNCIGCSGGLMVALLFVGVSNIAWMVIVSAIVLIYKVAPPSLRVENAIASMLLAVGVWVAVLPSTVPGLFMPA